MYENQGTLKTPVYCFWIQEIFENIKLLNFNMYELILVSASNKYLNLNSSIKMQYDWSSIIVYINADEWMLHLKLINFIYVRWC